MFSSEYGEAIVEVLDILNNTRKEDVEKIPTSFMEFLVKNSARNYSVEFDHTKPLNELNLMKKTREILGLIYINWWCGNDEYEKYMTEIRENREKVSAGEHVANTEHAVSESTVANVEASTETNTVTNIVENSVVNVETSTEISNSSVVNESKATAPNAVQEVKAEETTKKIETTTPAQETSNENKMLVVVNEKKGIFHTIINKITSLFHRQKVEVKN